MSQVVVDFHEAGLLLLELHRHTNSQREDTPTTLIPTFKVRVWQIIPAEIPFIKRMIDVFYPGKINSHSLP